MANLLTPLDNASCVDLRNQIAVYKIITLNNVLGLQAKKAYVKFADITNYLGNVFTNKKLLTTKKPKELDERIQEYIKSLESYTKDELKSLFIEAIIKRLDVPKSTPQDWISGLIVNRAAQYLDISRNLSETQKIDAVYSRYSERIEELAKKQFDNATPEEQKKIKDRIDENLGALSDYERKQINEALKVDKVTSDTIIRIMKTTGITGTLMTGGAMFGSYIVLSVVLHGIFTTLLGITLPFAVYTGAASTLSFLTGPIGWLALGAFGVWQYKNGSSKVDGEIFCQTVFLTRYLNKVSFEISENDVPNWLSYNDKDVKIIENEKITEYFNQALDSSKKELDIFSPWLGAGVITESFITKVEKLLSNGVIVKVVYGIESEGYYSSREDRDKKSDEIAANLKNAFDKYPNFSIKKVNSHGKLLICDNRYYLIGSFNFLSFRGDYTTYKKTRAEICQYSTSLEMILYLRNKFFNF